MAFSLTWLPQVLKDAGLKVATVDGWLERGRGDVGRTLGVICHHTVGRREGNMPSLDLLIKGRPDLPGPLSQLGLGRDGTYYVIAAGRCNHAGAGEWNGVKAGNTHFIGIEAEHTGQPTDPWPAVQTDAYERGVAAMLKHLGLAATACAGHKEWAPKRKTDPTFDMALFRTKVAAILAGTAPAPVLIPAVEPPAPGGAGRGTLRRGATGPLVTELQKRLGITADGDFGAHTEAAVRAFQRTRNMVPDGIFGPKSWAALDAIPAGKTAATAATTNGTTDMATTPWPRTLASKVVAAYINGRFGVSPGELMVRNPPMGAMPFFNNSASAEVRRGSLALEAGEMLKFLQELSVPFEEGSSLDPAHVDLVDAMMEATAPSSGMSVAVNKHYRFLDEV
jgi:hypothetical protein